MITFIIVNKSPNFYLKYLAVFSLFSERMSPEITTYEVIYSLFERFDLHDNNIYLNGDVPKGFLHVL